METTLLREAKRCVQPDDETWKALNRYAADLGVSVDHVIVGALKFAAEVYGDSTGSGMIPLLR